MITKPIPEGFEGLIPSLVVNGADRAIEYYKKVFGATELMRMNYPDGSKVAHAELKIADHVLMLGDECPGMGPRAPQPGSEPLPCSIMIYVPNVDQIYNRALSLGGRSVMPPADMFWGDRFGKFIDPFGHQWGVATHTRDVSPEECAKAMAEWGKEKTPA
jgi:PhnB protein